MFNNPVMIAVVNLPAELKVAISLYSRGTVNVIFISKQLQVVLGGSLKILKDCVSYGVKGRHIFFSRSESLNFIRFCGEIKKYTVKTIVIMTSWKNLVTDWYHYKRCFPGWAWEVLKFCPL